MKGRPGFLPELEDDVPIYELLSWGLCGIKARRAIGRIWPAQARQANKKRSSE